MLTRDIIVDKTIRIITKTSSKDRISQHLYKFEVAKLMYQFTHKQIPNLFCQYFTYSNDIFKYATRNSANYNLHLPQFSSNRTN